MSIDIDLREIVEASEGLDPKGMPKSQLQFVSTVVNVETGESDGNTFAIETAEVQIRDIGKFVMLDVIFPTKSSVDLKMLYSYLEDYAKDLDELTDKSVDYPEVALFVSPLKYQDEYYILFQNPIFWSYNYRQNTDDEGANVLRILFEEDKVGFFKDVIAEEE